MSTGEKHVGWSEGTMKSDHALPANGHGMGTTLIGIVFNGTIILGADRRQLTYRDGAFADQSKIRKYLRLRLNASKTTDAIIKKEFYNFATEQFLEFDANGILIKDDARKVVSFSINDRQRGKFNVAVAFAGALEVKKKFESEATSNRSVFPPKNLTTLFETLAEYMAEVDMGVIDTLKGMQQSLVSDERARIEKLIQFVKEEGMSTVIVGIVPSTVLPSTTSFATKTGIPDLDKIDHPRLFTFRPRLDLEKMKKNEEFFYFDPKKVQSHPLIVTKGIECMEAERVYLMAVAQDHSANRPDPPTTEEVCNWVFSSIIGAHAIHKWIPGGNEKMGVTWTNDELFAAVLDKDSHQLIEISRETCSADLASWTVGAT